jgi:hypothetical protein
VTGEPANDAHQPPHPPSKRMMLVGFWLRSPADGVDAALLALIGFVVFRFPIADLEPSPTSAS